MSILSRIFKKQEQREQHLTFRGVEIDGPISAFKEKMQELGYMSGYEDEKTGSVVFDGSFSGKEGCMICVLNSKEIDKVYKVEVSFPEDEDWSRLKQNYFFYKELLTEKYGEPCTSYEMNLPEYKFEEIDEMQGLIEGKCLFTSIFETTLGHILLKIDSADYGVFIKIGYEDRLNQALREKAEREIRARDL